MASPWERYIQAITENIAGIRCVLINGTSQENVSPRTHAFPVGQILFRHRNYVAINMVAKDVME